MPARRHEHLLVHMLAALQAGAHYVIVDDNYPLSRQEFIQKMAKARFGLRAAGHASLNGLDVQWLQSKETLFEAALPALEPETPAYVMFTSGSTGTPKGGHRSPSRHRQTGGRHRLYPFFEGQYFSPSFLLELRCLDIGDLGRLAARWLLRDLSGR